MKNRFLLVMNTISGYKGSGQIQALKGTVAHQALGDLPEEDPSISVQVTVRCVSAPRELLVAGGALPFRKRDFGELGIEEVAAIGVKEQNGWARQMVFG